MKSFAILNIENRVIKVNATPAEVFQVIALDISRKGGPPSKFFLKLSTYKIYLSNDRGLPFVRVNCNNFITYVRARYLNSRPVEVFRVIDPNNEFFGFSGEKIPRTLDSYNRNSYRLQRLTKEGAPIRDGNVRLKNDQVASLGLHPSFKVYEKLISKPMDQCIEILEGILTGERVTYPFPEHVDHDLSWAIPGIDTELSDIPKKTAE